MEVNKIKKSHEKSFLNGAKLKVRFFVKQYKCIHPFVGRNVWCYRSWCLANQIVLEQ